MRKPTFLLIVCCLLAACVGNPPRQNAIILHDLGDIGGPAVGSHLPIVALEVKSATWLDAATQHYRLAYADPLRRQAYAESRWAAPPAQLVERLLQRRLLSAPVAVGDSGCRLRFLLEEFEQGFDSPHSSRMMVEGRVTLMPLRRDMLLAQRVFQVGRPAATADARGGVQAARTATEALAGEIAQWLNELAGAQPGLLAICKG